MVSLHIGGMLVCARVHFYSTEGFHHVNFLYFSFMTTFWSCLLLVQFCPYLGCRLLFHSVNPIYAFSSFLGVLYLV